MGDLPEAKRAFARHARLANGYDLNEYHQENY
jgi:hypothetical protein